MDYAEREVLRLFPDKFEKAEALRGSVNALKYRIQALGAAISDARRKGISSRFARARRSQLQGEMIEQRLVLDELDRFLLSHWQYIYNRCRRARIEA